MSFPIFAEAPLLRTDTALLLLVTAGLLVLTKVVMDLRARVARLSPPAASATPAIPSSPGKTPTSPPPEEASLKVRAAIAAAVYEVYGPHSRVITISPLVNTLWSQEGRRMVFQSHRLR